jgi:hypothetical protein
MSGLLHKASLEHVSVPFASVWRTSQIKANDQLGYAGPSSDFVIACWLGSDLLGQ